MKTHVKLLVLAMVLVMFALCLAACGGTPGTTTTEAPATTTTAAPADDGEYDLVVKESYGYTGSALNVATAVKPSGVRTTFNYKKVDANGTVIADLGTEKPVDCGKYTVTVSFAWVDTAKTDAPHAPITKEFSVVAGKLADQADKFGAQDTEILFKTVNMNYNPVAENSTLVTGFVPAGIVRSATIVKLTSATDTGAGTPTAVAGAITSADSEGYYRVTISYAEEAGKDNFSDESTVTDTAIVYARPIGKTAAMVATNAITVDGTIDNTYGAPVFETKYQAHTTKTSSTGATVFDKIDLSAEKFVDPYEYAALMEISKGANTSVDAANYNYATAKFYAVWDGAFIYIAIEVTDNTPFSRTAAYTSAPNPWVNDNLELYYSFGGDAIPDMTDAKDTYPTYKTVVRDAVSGTQGFTGIKSQKSHYYDDIVCAVSGRNKDTGADDNGDNKYVIEYKFPAKSESFSGTPGATGDQAFATIAGNNLVAGDFIFLAYQLNDLFGLPENKTAIEYDAQIGQNVTGNKYKDMEYGVSPEKDSPWYNFEFDAAAYCYAAGNRSVSTYLKVAECAPMILTLGAAAN